MSTVTLDNIIRRRKKETLKHKPAQKEEPKSWSTWTWVIIAIVVIVLLLCIAAWWYWSTPSSNSSSVNSILDEMKASDSSKQIPNIQGVITLDEFRDYNSRFSRNITSSD